MEVRWGNYSLLAQVFGHIRSAETLQVVEPASQAPGGLLVATVAAAATTAVVECVAAVLQPLCAAHI